MISRRLIFIIISLAVSMGAVLLVRQLLTGQEARAQSRFASSGAARPVDVRVLVASTTLPAGSVLQSTSLRWQTWPKTDLSDAYLVEGAATVNSFTGGVLRSRLTAGEPLSADIVSRVGQGGSLAEILSPGSRAVTINLSPSSGMAGFVRPGDRVDLILSSSHASTGQVGQPAQSGETLLTDLRVVGIDQSLSDDAKKDKGDKKDVVAPKTATLEVTPRQAEIVAAAADLGGLSLSLRSLASPDAGTPAAGSHVAEGGVMRRTRTAAASRRTARAPAASRQVNVYRGGVLDAASANLPMKATS